MFGIIGKIMDIEWSAFPGSTLDIIGSANAACLSAIRPNGSDAQNHLI
jgi:hypothetical protein